MSAEHPLNLDCRVWEESGQLQEALSKAEQANRQKSRVLAHVSHDLKTPLTGMAWFLQGLQNDDSLGVSQQKTISHIQDGLQQIRNILRDMLDKVRLEDGAITLAPETIELDPFLQQVKRMLYPQMTENNVDLSISSDVDSVFIDRVHLRQILVNLLSNAVKYNRQGGHVFLEVRRSNSVTIEVRDTGIGIPADKLPRIFSSYFRVRPNSAIEGAGLGLAYTKKMVEYMGGTIDVASEPDKGTLFTIHLPETV